MSVAKSLPHDAATLHVTGKARYTDDIPAPRDALHLAFGLSTIARGSILSMDLTAVRAAPGVVQVITVDDLPFDNDVSPGWHDEPLLATGRVNHIGQPLFIVVATSHLAARKAARKAKVEYQAEEPILTIEQALAADSRFEKAAMVWTKGDAPAALQTAPHRLTGSLSMGGQEHFYLEGQVAMAWPQENGDMLVNCSTQHPSEIQHKVAEALGTHMHGVRVETRRMGGGFGGKESQGNALAVACAIAARATGRVCRMRYDRDDDMMITGKRHDFRIDYTVGYDDTGRILAIDVTHYTRCGWAQDLSLAVADRAMLHAENAYLIADMRITSHRLKTNMQSATAYRGFGGPQGLFGMEQIIAHLSHTTGIDAITLRRRNYYQPMEAAGVDNTTPYGMQVTDFILQDMTDRLMTTSDYASRRAAVDEWNAQNDRLKKGLAFSPVKFGISFTATQFNQAGSLVHIYQDGSVSLNHGGTEMGQGLFQKVAQIAAKSLGIDIDRIRITATDTAKVPNTSATAASSGSDLNGAATHIACETLRTRMAEALGPLYQTNPTDVRFVDDQVHFTGQSITFPEAARICYNQRVALSATGHYKTPDISWDRIKGQGRAFYYFAYGCAVTEVVLDTLTGENRILRADILHDTGASLNPVIDIGQIEGAYVQGAGWLTTEELVWDDKGMLRTHAPSTYKIPACSDRPRIFNVDLVNRPAPLPTIYRSKAVGEPPFMHGISAFLALQDAVCACGPTWPELRAPATAEAILTAIGRTRS
ncbi:xanthine dehydrogenase molybdopterin binding subunit [Ketogulonicigenium vulgare]|uniref:xanthine dehydrogenase molybdopterin binding subunit n=1 Tax=Ketogulonicigenium vulgare TaxID=92945 RepID=UPI0001E677A5|nr:xanthine dehydrogenase molybdopterin binding subunit [Ketogulonicigenium vulgare]ADO41441.1 xanthine dehydrogenase, B subunit [Ketogulonicigenium vulgare Y25]ALJ80053.1 aldehyde oxidase [Ketogulonicigenium vulgare]ANW32934.1 xanthine dehydrogenase molybdopterin binding subunit [Ketogulonicigenium vulgare]AOZ53526.1 xanthine dehydrogenase, molybdopterin binding subunit [Ketogulonicigenium vulgare]